MEQHDDATASGYPLGRGYGHDYMRGGEVLGGYGYSARKEYERPRGAEETSQDAGESTEGEEEEAIPDPSAGGAVIDAIAAALSQQPATQGGTPIPQIEHTFGIDGSATNHSRSFYITQAQLQQRVYIDARRGASRSPRRGGTS
jgi:hypothetical protein